MIPSLANLTIGPETKKEPATGAALSYRRYKRYRIQDVSEIKDALEMNDDVTFFNTDRYELVMRAYNIGEDDILDSNLVKPLGSRVEVVNLSQRIGRDVMQTGKYVTRLSQNADLNNIVTLFYHLEIPYDAVKVWHTGDYMKYNRPHVVADDEDDFDPPVQVAKLQDLNWMEEELKTTFFMATRMIAPHIVCAFSYFPENGSPKYIYISDGSWNTDLGAHISSGAGDLKSTQKKIMAAITTLVDKASDEALLTDASLDNVVYKQNTTRGAYDMRFDKFDPGYVATRSQVGGGQSLFYCSKFVIMLGILSSTTRNGVYDTADLPPNFMSVFRDMVVQVMVMWANIKRSRDPMLCKTFEVNTDRFDDQDRTLETILDQEEYGGAMYTAVRTSLYRTLVLKDRITQKAGAFATPAQLSTYKIVDKALLVLANIYRVGQADVDLIVNAQIQSEQYAAAVAAEASARAAARTPAAPAQQTAPQNPNRRKR
jgi:hypothetical protein